MSQIEIRQVTADDHAAWLPLWQAYLRFYNTELPEAVTHSTWQRMLDHNEPTHSALAWLDGKAVGMVNFIYHRSNWSIENSCAAGATPLGCERTRPGRSGRHPRQTPHQ